jgi:hypothetical protein
MLTCSSIAHVLDIDERFNFLGLFKPLSTILMKIIILKISKLGKNL